MGSWRWPVVVISLSTIDDGPRCSIDHDPRRFTSDDVLRLVIRARLKNGLIGASRVASGTKPRLDHLCRQNSADTFTASEPKSEQRLQPQMRNDSAMSDLPAHMPRDQVRLNRGINLYRSQRGHRNSEPIQDNDMVIIQRTQAQSSRDRELGPTELGKSING